MAPHPEARTGERRSSKRKDLLATARCKVRDLWTKNGTPGKVWFSNITFSKKLGIDQVVPNVESMHETSATLAISSGMFQRIAEGFQLIPSTFKPLELNYTRFEQFQLKVD